MSKSRISIALKVGVFLVATAIVVASTLDPQSRCTACNCQFNNIELLDQLLEAKMNQILVNEPSELSPHAHCKNKMVST